MYRNIKGREINIDSFVYIILRESESQVLIKIVSSNEYTISKDRVEFYYRNDIIENRELHFNHRDIKNGCK